MQGRPLTRTFECRRGLEATPRSHRAALKCLPSRATRGLEAPHEVHAGAVWLRNDPPCPRLKTTTTTTRGPSAVFVSLCGTRASGTETLTFGRESSMSTQAPCVVKTATLGKEGGRGWPSTLPPAFPLLQEALAREAQEKNFFIRQQTLIVNPQPPASHCPAVPADLRSADPTRLPGVVSVSWLGSD
nr:uncharacterized protein LOC105874636 isoform X2 [Microcebus murinus]